MNKKWIRRALLTVCFAVPITGLTQLDAMAAMRMPGRGWEEFDGNWYYVEDGGYCHSGWLEIGGKIYYFDANCVMVSGWQRIDEKWYYFNPDGDLCKGWTLLSDKWYFFDEHGVMQTGWVYDNGKYYYMSDRGIMQTGWVYDKEKYYYLNDQGIMQSGWITAGSETYYLNSSGAMVTGWEQIDGKWYHFDSSGHMQRDTWIGSYYVGNDGVWVDKSRRSTQLNVKCIYQRPELPNGCEVTSLDIVLQYMGYPIKKGELSDRYLPQGSIGRTSPYSAFIGNPRNRNSWYCYSPVIVRCANSYLKSVGSDIRAEDLTGASFDTLLQELQQGRPVIFWATLSMGSPRYGGSWNVNGKRYVKYFNLHCMVLTGYDLDKNIVYVADPLRGNVTYNLRTCKLRYEQLHSQAVVLK